MGSKAQGAETQKKFSVKPRWTQKDPSPLQYLIKKSLGSPVAVRRAEDGAGELWRRAHFQSGNAAQLKMGDFGQDQFLIQSRPEALNAVSLERQPESQTAKMARELGRIIRRGSFLAELLRRQIIGVKR